MATESTEIQKRLEVLRAAHRQQFGDTEGNPVIAAFSPGRAEVLGNHTDYSQGYTLSANTSDGIAMVGSARTDGRIRIYDERYDISCEFRIGTADELLAQKATAKRDAWCDYIKGVVWSYARAGISLTGADIAFNNTLASGGMSASAALETAASRLLSTLAGVDVPALRQVELCKQAENEYVGMPCGFLDQATVGLAEQCLFIDYRPEHDKPFTYAQVPMDLAAGATPCLLVIGHDPESKHSLTDGKYAARFDGCARAAQLLGDMLGRDVSVLRDVSAEEFAAHKQQLQAADEEAARYAEHVINENQRVLDARHALQDGDLTAFGALMTASGRSALDLHRLDDDCPELRWTYEIISAHAGEWGVLGTRNMGGGFNATTLSLVRADSLKAFESGIVAAYRARFGRAYHLVETTPSPAARIVAD